jgi:hypothetical protein
MPTGWVVSLELPIAWALALAPAEPASEPEPDNLREYSGQEAVSAPATAKEVTTAPSGTRERLPGVQPSAVVRPTDGSLPPATILDVSAFPPGPDARPLPRPIPRILTTMYGWHPGEEAKHRAKGVYFSFTPGLQVRSRIGAVSEFTLDDEGNRYAEGAHVDGRMRWRPVFGFGRKEPLKLVGMLDLASGRWAPLRSGDPVIQEILDDGQPPVPTRLRVVDPRELYLQWTFRYGQLRLGQMSFVWGQGLVANDGNNMDRFGDLKFGDDGDGSIQERILFATKPMARGGGPGKDVIFALGADLIFRDPNADLVQGDLAGQGIFVVRWEPSQKPGNWLGAYAVYRRQNNADDGDAIAGDDLLEVGAADIAGQGFRYLRPDLALIGAFEAVVIGGRTTFQRGDHDESQVLQGAAALRAYIGNPSTWLAGLDAGWMSGDANPDDAEVNNFQAAPGYTAGLLLFQYYEGWQSARSELQALDPNLAGVPPNGTQYIPTEGSVTNVLFAHPKARWGLWERFEVWGGPLVAASAVPLVDPVETQLNGGAPTNALGGLSDRRYLGTELDLGIRGRYGFRNLWLQAGLQGGVLFPGPAFVDASGDADGAIFGGWFRAEIRY